MKRVGEVKMYDHARSFGFIQEWRHHGTEAFFHISHVVDRTILQLGDVVTFEMAPNPKRPGQMMAVNVSLSKRDEVADTTKTTNAADAVNAPKPEVRP
jgi:cold shock CspA family protein